MGVLSFQSQVAYGHVGNAAAVFCLQRLGIEAWPVATVSFSNHPGHGRWRGRVVPAGEVAELVAGIEALGAFARCRAVLTGYLGSAETGRVVLDAVARVKAGSPGALYCCDPVMGDDAEGAYVAEPVAAFLEGAALAAADIVLPNAFELGRLAHRPVARLDDALAAARLLLAAGPRLVVATSVPVPDRDELTVVAVGKAEAWQVTTPRLPLAAKGAGDAFAALFLGFWLARPSPREALERAVAATYGLVAATSASGGDELALVEAQNLITRPPRRFRARRIG